MVRMIPRIPRMAAAIVLLRSMVLESQFLIIILVGDVETRSLCLGSLVGNNAGGRGATFFKSVIEFR